MGGADPQGPAPAKAGGATAGLAHGYQPALDGLRAVAVSLVFVYHAARRSGSPSGTFEVLVHKASQVGWIGVDLFFVLSGFLITRILVANKGDRARHYFGTFYARRALRIFPLYYVVVPAVLAYIVLRGNDLAVSDWLPQLTYTQNLVPLPRALSSYLSHTWSLAVEEHFYLLWPVAVFALSAWSLRRLAVIGMVAVLLLRIGVDSMGYGSILYTATPFRIDTLLAGALLALAWDGPLRRWLKVAAPLAAALFVAAGALAGSFAPVGFNRVYGFTLAAIASMGAVAWTAGPARNQGPLARPSLVYVGRISYGIYLFHVPILSLGNVALGMAMPGLGYLAHLVILLAVGGAATLAISALSFRFFEAPILRLKDRFRYGRPIPTP
jgi:peptidoglycan/LPS O-acetylase OafA/YrhL